MKILVVLASYGHTNDQYLTRVLGEYRSMRHDIDVVVVSNIHKDLGPGVEVVVGLPSKNPYSLPFAHKKVMSERRDQYDLFIYSEDDILITERNIEAFLEATSLLRADEIAGFMHAETDSDGNMYFDPPHASFHWDPGSVTKRGNYTFAFYTNVHSASFMLTPQQLELAIASGGFLVEPHEGRFELRETAATDPYTQCGFRKLICISHIDRFTVRHLPANKLAVRPYRAKSEVYRQIEALLRIRESGRPQQLLFEPETKLLHRKWSKDYYEPVNTKVLSLIPSGVQNVLSVGCGWGATEECLVKSGARVLGVPMDSVIAASAESRGVEIVCGGLQSVLQDLRSQRFDCILFSNVLHLVPDPSTLISSFSRLLSPKGIIVAVVPNFYQLKTRVHRLRGRAPFGQLGDYDICGVHVTTPTLLRRWFREAGLTRITIAFGTPDGGKLARMLLSDAWVCEELICTGSSDVLNIASVTEAQIERNTYAAR